MAGLIVHSAFLLFSGLFCFLIAAINRKYCLAGDFCKILTVGFFTAGFVDIFHALATATDGFICCGASLAWFASRFALLQMFLMIALVSHKKAASLNYKKLGQFFFIPQIFISVLIVCNMFDLVNFKQYEQSAVQAKPFEIVLLVGFLVAWIALYQRRRFKYCFPLGAFNVFIISSVAIHFIVGFLSNQVLDSAFMFAALIKLGQYGLFAILLVNMVSYFEMKDGFLKDGQIKQNI